MARFGGRRIVTEEDFRTLQTIVNGNGTPTIAYLDSLRLAARPAVDSLAQQIEAQLGLRTEVNAKNPITAAAKAQRPHVLKKYPWFTLAHLRDYLRFRTHLTKIDDFFSTMDFFDAAQTSGVLRLVKIDSAKIGAPGPFGWRMVATDLRILPSGMLVEHYMTFGDMIAINEDWLHNVYDKWRSVSPTALPHRQLVQMNRDTAFSTKAYLEFMVESTVRSPPPMAALLKTRAGNTGAALNRLISRI